MFSYLKKTQACSWNCLQLNEEYYQQYERFYVLALSKIKRLLKWIYTD